MENNEKEEEKKDVVKQEQKKETTVQSSEKTKFNKVEEQKAEKISEKSKNQKNIKQKENKKSKNKYYIGATLVVILLLVVVAGLILLPKTPEKTVEGLLNCLKNGDFESANKYINYEEFKNNIDILGNTIDDKETQALFFNKLNWKILKINKEENTAKVEIEITNKDFEQIISNYTDEALRIAFSGQAFSKEDQINKLKEELKNEQIGTKTVTATIELNKENNEWKIKINEEFINAILPGLQEAVNSINSIIG